MLDIYLQFAVSALAIVIAATFLTRFADKIADATGMGRIFIGGIMLAGATSLPELMVDLRAIKQGLPDLAVGDLLGSGLLNLLILAGLDFTFPTVFRRTAFSPEFLHHALAAVLSIMLASVVGIGMALHMDLEFFGANIFIWTALIFYVFGLKLIHTESGLETLPENSRKGKAEDARRPLYLMDVLGFAASAGTIFFLAPFLVEAADGIAKHTRLDHTFVGTTLLAITTSLPELITTMAAFRMGAPDLALGNIFGSNCFNMVLFLVLDIAHPGDLFHAIQGRHVVTAFCLVVATSLAVLGQLFRKKERMRFAEPSSEMVVAVSMLALILLYLTRS